jgi:protein-disulfide isomerase
MKTEYIQTEKLALPVGRRDHIQGPLNTRLTLLVYGDYECLACGEAYWTIRTVRANLHERLRFVFRNFPLANDHPHAGHAAEAAEAAGAQGKFWEMHNILFENQDALDDGRLATYAELLGLDPARLIGEVENGAHIGRVREDFKSGIRSGVNGTPTFFINGRRYEGPRDPEALIDTLIQESRGPA